MGSVIDTCYDELTLKIMMLLKKKVVTKGAIYL